MKLFWSFIVTLVLASALSANCGKCDMKGMNKDNSSNANCKMHMKKKDCNKADCKMQKKKQNCKMQKNCDQKNCKMKEMKKSGSCGTGKCGKDMMKKDEMSGNAGKKMQGSCGAGKCGKDMMKKDKSKNCGCGMTIESCEKMMPSCKYRDERKAKEAEKK